MIWRSDTTNADPNTTSPATIYNHKALASVSVRQMTHWGEVVQGPVRHNGSVITALITMPRADLSSTATFTPGLGPLTVSPAWCRKAHLAARTVLDRADMPFLGGRLLLTTDIPTGCGGGSTTADITATIRAVSRTVGLELTDEEVQALDWEIERAADPLALLARGRAVVYGSRTGQIVRWLSRALPEMWCMGFNTSPGKTVLTDELARRTEYTADEEAAFYGILVRATTAIDCGNVSDLALAATDSARLNQPRVPTRNFEQLVQIVIAAGAAGLSVSHSGTVAAAMFDPAIRSLRQRMRDLAAVLRAIGCSDIASFKVIG